MLIGFVFLLLYFASICTKSTLNASIFFVTNKQEDSKSDVLLCFDTKFKSQVDNKLFESDTDIKRIFYLTSPEKTVEWSKA